LRPPPAGEVDTSAQVGKMKKTMAFGAFLAIAAGALASEACFSQSSDDSVVDCTQIAGKDARLRCYDDRMTRLGHKIASDDLSVAPKRTAEAKAASAQNHSDFSMAPSELRKKREVAEQSPQELVAKVKAVNQRAHGELSIQLDNDQVWVETQYSGEATLAAGDTVTIKRGTLGSYFLTRESGRALRIKRVR
jgi:hypothetical protein